MIPDIAIGAIAAAIIGALISLVGLIVAKESKVSEFRQAWIDALRGELALFMSNANAVLDTRELTFSSANKRFDTLQPYTTKLNESYYLVALRLNAEEESAKKLRACMVSILKSLGGTEDLDMAEFEKARVAFINASNFLLKEEWKRVKSGEMVYRGTRWIAAIALFVLLALGAVAVLTRDHEPGRRGTVAATPKARPIVIDRNTAPTAPKDTHQTITPSQQKGASSAQPSQRAPAK